MKQITTLLIATVVTLTSFASVKPFQSIIVPAVKAANSNVAALSLKIETEGKVNLTWTASTETATTVYYIEKSFNKAAFKTVAILMGETNTTYSYRDNVKDITGNFEYRIVTVNDDKVVNTLTQQIVIQ
jgi:hypothetical protein